VPVDQADASEVFHILVLKHGEDYFGVFPT
jgi:hypothetical protein